MKRLVAALCFALALAAPAVVSATFTTIRISLVGSGLAPIDITEPGVVAQFHVWAGPGTAMSVRDAATGAWTQTEGTEGFIIDWRAGEVERVPDALDRFETSFHVGTSSADERLAYVVTYARDRESGEGYVFLPGPGDERFALNTRSIHRGREGKWYRASAAWQAVVSPLIAARAL